ncbi:MAG: hypothetical protein MZV63_21800 [Marinilabiliales bacterium]|nr:hypothetical protein [Marinilabiliales bacterium]
MRRFRINIKEDHEMYLINCRILDAAETRPAGSYRFRALRPYIMGGCLQEIAIPSMVVVASKGYVSQSTVKGLTFLKE